MAAVCVVRQSICAIRENRRNGLSEPGWSMQNALAEEQAVQCSVPGHFLYAHSTGRKGRPYVKTWLFMEYGSLSKFRNMVLYPSSLTCCRKKINKQYGTILHTV